MLYLYVKTHAKTGLKYLGYTTSKDPYVYTGSGKYWKRHLKKYGNNCTTQILLMTEDKEELKETGLFFSKLWDIVQSSEWANLKTESGDGGWDHIDNRGRIVSEETKRKQSLSASVRLVGDKNPFYGKHHSEESKKIIGEASKKRAKRIYNQRLQQGNHPNNNCVCPHCNKEGQYRAMKRWHFDNCKIIS
jgi:hypothetical protein